MVSTSTMLLLLKAISRTRRITKAMSLTQTLAPHAVWSADIHYSVESLVNKITILRVIITYAAPDTNVRNVRLSSVMMASLEMVLTNACRLPRLMNMLKIN